MVLDALLALGRIALAEAAKGAASEAGAAFIRRYASARPTEPGEDAEFDAERLYHPAEDPVEAWPGTPETTNDSPTHEAEAVAHAFFDALRTSDRRGALSWCDTDWRNDPERAPALRQTLDAAPPLSWAFREVSVPHDWDERSPLPWIQVEAVVTYEADGGRFEGLPTRFWVADTRYGWKVWNIVWWPDGEPGFETDETVDLSDLFPQGSDSFAMEARQVIPCTRCPQKLSIPVGVGRLRVKCPECWTVQFVDS